MSGLMSNYDRLKSKSVKRNYVRDVGGQFERG